MSFISKLSNYNDASYCALWVQTHEEERLVAEIRAGLSRPSTKTDPGRQIYSWDSLNGLCEYSSDTLKKIHKSETPQLLFERIKELTALGSEKIYVLKDFHLQFGKPINGEVVIRGFKNLIPLLKASRNLILFVSPNVKIPIEIQKEIQLLSFDLPTETEIKQKLSAIHEGINQNRKQKDKLILEAEIEDLSINAAKGMTASEIENAFALAIVENKAFDRNFVKSVFTEKVQQIKKGGILTPVESNISFSNVGGLHRIKEWITLRKAGFSKEAREYKLPYPKGIGLAGIPGCGKTLISKAIANEFNFPLYQLDLGSLFGKYVGETENNFIQMTKTIDSIGRCVILIDEVEKYLNVSATSGKSDTGTSSRSFGTLLSWMSDRNNPAFIICTSNNHIILPPELVRKGRFDEWFWVDLPNSDERRDVLNVVLKKYDRNSKNFDVEAAVTASNEFSGSEIEVVFIDAMYSAFAEQREVTTDDFLAKIKETTPQSSINREWFEQMRSNTEGRLRAATSSEAISMPNKQRKIHVNAA